MQNRRDQVQAHMFIMGRLTSGLLRTDLDAPESPVGRTNRGLVIGVVVAVLVAAGAFVFGLISPGTKGAWQVSGALIIDKDTGSRYLYADGELHPVLNYASALLLVGSANLSTTTVGNASLRHAPRGGAVGISGAPDTLPATGDLGADRPWLVCSTDASSSSTVLAVGSSAVRQGLPDGGALLVSGPDRTRYLVWEGSRLRIDSASGALESLGYGTVTPRQVSAAFLDALPAGPDLAPADVPGRGDAGPSLGGLTTKVGQVFQTQVPGSAAQYYLLRREGLVPLTATEAALQLGAPDAAKKAYAGGSAVARELQAGVLKGHLAAAATSGASAASGDLPAAPPTAAGVADGSAVCVGVQPGSSAGSGSASAVRVSVALVPASSLTEAAPVTADRTTAARAACLPVDRVAVEPGGGALVQALNAGGGATDGSTYLVTDTGQKYLVPSADDLTALGYTTAEVRQVPSLLLSMLPAGPDLDTSAASGGGGAGGGPGTQGCGSAAAKPSVGQSGGPADSPPGATSVPSGGSAG